MEYIKGPKWNSFDCRKIKGEDHLGIKNTAIIISDYLQTGITSITPRARYWSFYTWVLYDFIENHTERTMVNFKRFLKKQEWFYILANIGEAEKRGTKIISLIGTDKGKSNWTNSIGVVDGCLDYVKNPLGGYGTAYRNVLKILGLTRAADNEKGVKIDRLTDKGKELAKAFEDTIKNTDYYINWRNKEEAVPKDVLTEYGQAAGLDRLNQDSKDLPIIKELFLQKDSKNELSQLRYESMMYYKFIIDTEDKKNLNFLKTWRTLMYDVYSVRGRTKKNVPKQFEIVSKGWEIYQGRQMFTYSLEAIWAHLLEHLSRKQYSYKTLVDKVLENLKGAGIDTDVLVKDFIENLSLKVDEREAYIERINSDVINVIENVYNPFKIMLEVYNRFLERDDLNEMHKDFLSMGNRAHISLKFWEKTIDEHKNKSIKYLIQYIMRYFILEQHQLVALNKLVSTNNETYHFVENDRNLEFIANDQPTFNVFRVYEGVSILKDLGCLSKS